MRRLSATVRVLFVAALGIVLAGFFPAPAGAAQDRSAFQLTGYWKSFFLILDPADPESVPAVSRAPWSGAVSNRLRIKAVFDPAAWFSIQAAYDLMPRISDPGWAGGAAGLAASGAASDYRLADLDKIVWPRPGDPAGNFSLAQNLDRLFATVRTPAGDFFIGRQPVAWGSSRVISPTDIIAPFAFDELDKEERRGVDAVRWRIPLGPLSAVDAGYVFGRDARADSSAAFVRGTFSLAKTDISLTVLGFRRDGLIGLDISRSIGGAAVWLEASWVRPGLFRSSSARDGSDYVRATAGLQTSLDSRTSGFVELHYNGAGASRASAYAGLAGTPAYTRGEVYLFGRSYGTAGVSWQVHPLVTLTALALANLSDGSAAVFPRLTWSFAENVDLEAGALIGTGRKPRLPSSGGALSAAEARSEFGAYPNFLFLSFRADF